MQSTSISLRPLSNIFGVEVVGVNAARVDDELKPLIRQAWLDHSLLLFRGQSLSTDEQLEFATIFGDVSTQGEDRPGGFSYVSNVVEDGVNPAGPLGFHFDHSFFPEPLSGLMLYALEAPPEGCGGETLFASAKLAYDSLPEELKERIRGLTIRHGWPDLSKHTELPGMDPRPEAPRADHPLEYTHPRTGDKLVFCSRRHVDHVLELPPDQSEALVNEITSYVRRPEIMYAHPWKPGDVIVWDNLALQHARSDFDPKYKRHIRRVQIA